MSTTNINTASDNFRNAHATAVTATSFAALADLAAEPTESSGVIRMGRNGVTSNAALVEFFGTDAANETGSYRIVAIRPDSAGKWCCTPIITGTFTLGEMTGVAGGDVTNSNLYADQLTIATGPANYDYRSSADDLKAWLLVDTLGAPFIRIDLHTGSSAASVNARVAKV